MNFKILILCNVYYQKCVCVDHEKRENTVFCVVVVNIVIVIRNSIKCSVRVRQLYIKRCIRGVS